MKKPDRRSAFVPQRSTGLQPGSGYSALVVLGAVMALALLSGCASVVTDAAAERWEYNLNTGYPVVGAGAALHL